MLTTLLIALPFFVSSVPGNGDAAFAAFAAQAPSESDLACVKAHLKFLSDDLLEGRAPATRGADLATQYLSSQLYLMGYAPGGDGSTYFQQVPLVGVTNDNAQSTAKLVIGSAKTEMPLAFLDEFVASDETLSPESSIDADVVFVGYGITAPEQSWDDYKGADVKGKVLLMLVNDPPSDDPKVFGGRGLTYYGRWTYKYEEAARRGARGAILMHRTDMAAYGWNVVRTSFARERPQVDTRSDGANRLALAGWMTEEKTRAALAAAGADLDALMKEAATKEFQPKPLPIRVVASLKSALRPYTTPNVLGLMKGKTRPDEVVVFSAHWDHLGKDEAKVERHEDGIYNGAVDNVTGCAALLWIAREFSRLREAPDRSILFLFTTAEEGGLRGSQYYAAHPTVPLAKIAADLNLDGLPVLGEPLQFEPLGYDRSTLKKTVELAAREFDVELLPDSSPELGLFYRSDHFMFARAGVPAVHFKPGRKYRGQDEAWGKAQSEDYTKQRYHQPSDQYDPSWDVSGLVKIARFAGRVGYRVANDPEMPAYFPGDEFAKAR